MFSRQPFVDDTDRRPYITAVFTWILSPSFFPFSFSSYSGGGRWGLGLKSDAHLLPQPPAHLSFKRRKPCRLLWTLRRLNSFKISFNYRPQRRLQKHFFWTVNYSFCWLFYYKDLKIYEEFMSLEARETCIRERGREAAKRFLDDNSRRSQKTLQGHWWLRKFQGCAVWTGVLAPSWDFVYRKQNIVIQTRQQDEERERERGSALSPQCHGHFVDMCEPLDRQKETCRKRQNGSNKSRKGKFSRKRRRRDEENGGDESESRSVIHFETHSTTTQG